MTFRGAAPDVAGYELGLRDRLGLLFFFLPPHRVGVALPKFLDFVTELTTEFPKLIVLEDFNLPSLGLEFEVASEFMVPW